VQRDEITTQRDEIATQRDEMAAQRDEIAIQRDEIAGQRDRLQAELGDVLEQLAAVGPAVEERDTLRAKVERIEAALAEAQAAAAGERDRLLGDVDRLESALAETQAAREQELGALRDELAHTREAHDGLQAALAEAHASTAEHERRLAEERELHAAERSELTAQRERLQHELGDAFERLAVLGAAAEERDELRNEVARLHTTLAELQESSAAELHAVVEERDNLTSELEEARELLRQAERVRESQIALEAERDRAVTELERLRTVAADAQAEAEEQTRLLADEQDRHRAERESLLAQRTLLEEELGNAIEDLAAAATAADEREAQLQKGSQRLLAALDAVRGLAAELVSNREQLPQELVTDVEPEPEPEAEVTVEAEPEAQTEPETEAGEPAQPEAESEAVDYSLFVPGPNGYDLIPQNGVPPRAGQTVELIFPDREEPAVFEVVRSGRTLPDGDVCVYLAQV
jgi:chromosome segregation ATPase